MILAPMGRKKARFEDPKVKQRFMVALTCLESRERACLHAGIAKSSLYEWIDKGKAGLEPYATFIQEMEVAEDSAELIALSTMLKCSQKGDWRAGQAYLKMVMKSKYGDSVVHKHEMTAETKAKKLEGLSDEQLAQLESIHQTLDEGGES